MVKLTLYLDKSVEQNAGLCFEATKKAKKKIETVQKVIEKAQKELTAQESAWQQQQEQQAQEKLKNVLQRKKHWYENFRWFTSSEGFLVVGGRDATTNEIIIKKHMENDDLVFHTDMAGSPFFLVKQSSQPGKKIGEETMQEAALATCTFSRAWKLGLTTTNTFWVKPEQVSKTPNPGEYMGKGAFMIRGKTNYVPVSMDAAIGITEEGSIMAGPLSAIRQHCKKYLRVTQGGDKASDVAKKIRAKISGELDEIIRALPAGTMKVDSRTEG